jgi:collagen type VII alpha
MFSPQGNYVQQGITLDYTPVSAVAAGAVVLIGTIPMIAKRDIAANTLGNLDCGGVFDVVKDGSAFSAGDAVYWNATGNPVVGTAGTGAATSTASGNNLLGVVTPDGAAVAGDSTVRVKLTAAKRTTTIGGAVTADSISGSSSTLPITGLAAAQGGTASLTGGTSSTAGNAGGAASLTGGTPGVTGVGGAATVTAGAGGATSGNGGVASLIGGAGTNGNATGGVANVTGGAGQGTGSGGATNVTGGASGAGATGNGGAASVTGGAATSTNGTGGAASLIGGLGTGTGAGGAITITSGAAGATGVAGAINIAVGAATSGNGSAITITGGNGAGGTNAGGNVNLVGGTAVSTGTPGEVQVNGDSGLIQISEALTATDATRTVFIATRACRFKGVKAVFSTASTSGTLQVEKCTGTTAPGSGTSLLTGTVSLSGTANTVVSGTLIATVASLTLAAGDRLSIVIAGTMTNLAGGRVTLSVAPA